MEMNLPRAFWHLGATWVAAATAAAAELAYHRILQDNRRYAYYARVVRQEGWIVLQYWFFYCYNSWRSGFHGVNDHESDWETIMVYLHENTGQLYPEWAAYCRVSYDYTASPHRRTA